MFLPLAALVLLVAGGIVHVLERVPAAVRPRIATGATAIVALLFMGLTAQRNTEYASAISIWQTVVERWPTGRAHYNLGVELKAAGRRAEAIAAFERALRDTPDAHYALGFERQVDQRYDEAAEHYRTYIQLRPMDANVVRAYHQLGRTLQAQGRHEEALAAFGDVLKRKAGDIDGLAGTADTLMALKRWPEAITAYQQYLAVNPGNSMARFNMGLALSEVNRHEDAAAAFSAVISREPSNVAAHINLANALGSMGRYGDAVQAFRRAAELETDPAAREEILAVVRDLIGH
jgi:tetratricopeptide (TPR) repeat protein